jgi:GAF domain-containing protein
VANVLLSSVDEASFERGLVLIRRQADDRLEVVAGWDRDDRPVEVGAQMDIQRVSPNLTVYSDTDREDASSNHRALDEVWARWVSGRQGAALASIPILFRGSPLGVLLVESCDPHGLNEKTLQPFVTLAAQAAVAIENRHLFDETRRAAEQEALLNEMLRNLATALNVSTIIDIVQDPLAGLVPFDCMSMALVDKDTETLEVFHPGGEGIEDAHLPPRGQITPLDETLAGQAIRTGKTTVFDLGDPNLVGLELEPLRQAGLETCIVIPMVYGRDVLGSLTLSHSSPRVYTTADVPLLERMAQLTAVALENARLFGQLSQRAVQLQTAAQVSQAATSILNLDQLMTETVKLIRDRFDLYYVGLFMVDAANEWAVLRAGTGEAGRIQLEQRHRLKIDGESMIGWCVANGQPRVAYDVGEEAIHFDNPVLPDTRSELALPLNSRGETIGALTVQSIFPAAFSHEDVTALQTMADQLGNAIQNARFFEQTQKALAETETLYIASAELNTARSYEDILSAVCRNSTLGTAQDAMIYLFDRPWTENQKPEWADAVARQTEGLPQAARTRLPIAAFSPGMAQFLRPDELTMVEDISSDSRMDDDLRADLLQRYQARAAVFAPLVVGGQWIGGITAFYQEPTVFPEAEVRRLTALSGQAAVVVQGLRHLQEIQARARREALIREITGKIRASTDLETILQTTVTEVSRALGTSHGAIRLGTEEPPQTGEDRKPPETFSPDLLSAPSEEDVGQSRGEGRRQTGSSSGNGLDAAQPEAQQEKTPPSQAGQGGQE